MISPEYGLRLLRLFYNYKRKKDKLPYHPFRLWIELSSICNYRCIMCPNKDLEKEDRGHMDFELFQKIADEAREYVFDINLAHRGESLLYGRLIEAIAYAKKNKLFTRLHTNGSLLTESLSRKIIQSGLDRISFSIDGYEKETYEKIRKGGSFNRTVQNILRFLEIRKEEKAEKPVTALEVIDFNSTENNQLMEAKKTFLNQFKNLPLDHFVVKELHNWAGQVEKRRRDNKYSLCPFPWNALVICWEGTVLPCTQDFFKAYSLGNVKEFTLQELWNNKKMVYLRRSLAEKKIKGLHACSKCDRIWRKTILGVPQEYLWRFLTKRMP